MVDAADSKSVAARRAGSSPAWGTIPFGTHRVPNGMPSAAQARGSAGSPARFSNMRSCYARGAPAYLFDLSVLARIACCGRTGPGAPLVCARPGRKPMPGGPRASGSPMTNMQGVAARTGGDKGERCSQAGVDAVADQRK